MTIKKERICYHSCFVLAGLNPVCLIKDLMKMLVILVYLIVLFLKPKGRIAIPKLVFLNK